MSHILEETFSHGGTGKEMSPELIWPGATVQAERYERLYLEVRRCLPESTEAECRAVALFNLLVGEDVAGDSEYQPFEPPAKKLERPAPEPKRTEEGKAAAQDFIKDKKVIGIATSLAALHLDTAIEPENFLFHHWMEAKRKVIEACEVEGYDPIEDIRLQLRVSVMVQPKGKLAGDE